MRGGRLLDDQGGGDAKDQALKAGRAEAQHCECREVRRQGGTEADEAEGAHAQSDQPAPAEAVGQGRQRPGAQRSEDNDRAEVREIRDPGAERVSNRGQLQDQNRAVPPRQNHGEPCPEQSADLDRVKPGHQSRLSLRRRYGPGPRKPHVAATWAIETPSSDGGPGSNQNARPSGTPTSAVASVSGHDHPRR